MTKLSGVPVSQGIAIGSAFVRYKRKLKVEKRTIDKSEIAAEINRFKQAIAEEVRESDNVINNYAQGAEEKELLSSHKMILQDTLLIENVTRYIEEQRYSAEYSLFLFLKEITATFSKMTNKYFAERIADYDDVLMRIIRRLKGESNNDLDEAFHSSEHDSVILVLEDISPTDVTKSYHSKVSGICLSKGSRTSHSAIIARALGMPAVVGVSNLFNKVSQGDTVIVDGNAGTVIVQPNEEILDEYQKKVTFERDVKKSLRKIIDDTAQTADGKRVELFCNIELEQEMEAVLEYDADGIGLFRTEYLFVGRKDLPTEEEQYQTYYNIASKMGDKPVIIRTYDLGGDKLADSINTAKEHNPFLGCRGIRLSLTFPEIFKTQIRALLRANELGNISVMFPMVSNVEEVIASKKIIEECKIELQREKIPFNPDIRLGVLIEIPAAVFCMRELAQECDFFSIGTNDLVQYSLAADRDNKLVEANYNPYHPAIIKLIAITIINAHRYGKPVSICGEIAGEEDFIPLLVGLDIDSLSVNPSSLLNVKKHLSTINYQQAKEDVRKLIKQ